MVPIDLHPEAGPGWQAPTTVGADGERISFQAATENRMMRFPPEVKMRRGIVWNGCRLWPRWSG